MGFTVEDFEDLVRLLEERPDWRARLRDVLLPREVLELPTLVAEMAAISRVAVARLGLLEESATRVEGQLTDVEGHLTGVKGHLTGVEGRLTGVEDRLTGVEGRLTGVEDRLTGVEGRLTGVEEHLTGVEGRLTGVEVQLVDHGVRLGRLQGGMQRLHSDLSTLKGATIEERYRELPRLFSHLIQQPVSLSRAELDDWLEAYVQAGTLTPAEAIRILRADLVFRGRGGDQPAALVVEVSWNVDVSDVNRAADRAMLLRKAVPATRAVVAGQRIDDAAAALAEERGVARVVEDEPDAESR